MRSGDLFWLAGLGGIILFLLLPATNEAFVAANRAAPYMMGFVKFAILATMGELLALRIVGGEWRRPTGMLLRALVWGFLGMVIVLMFTVFSGGVAAAITQGLLPGGNGPYRALATAFWISTVMNLAYAPTFMAVHRITDTYIDLAGGQVGGLGQVSLRKVVSTIDWQGFISFVVLRTLPLFWIPAHTVTFLLPAEYRVLMAAFLSIALGAILAFAKRRPALKRVK
jgi:hypothetical protein